MYTLLVILHVVVSLILIMVVLLQSGKGASMGAAFGGGSQAMFGARGQTTGIQKMTVGAAVLFMVLSVALASMSSQGRSGLEDYVPPAAGHEAGMMPAEDAAADKAKADQAVVDKADVEEATDEEATDEEADKEKPAEEPADKAEK